MFAGLESGHIVCLTPIPQELTIEAAQVRSIGLEAYLKEAP